MILRNHISMRTLFLSLLLTTPLLGVGCWEPEKHDAEIGCGVDAMVSAKCPNRPPAEAGPPSPDGSPDGGAADTSGISDTGPAIPDSAPDSLVIADDAPVADASVADSTTDRSIATDTNSPSDSAPGTDALVD